MPLLPVDLSCGLIPKIPTPLSKEVLALLKKSSSLAWSSAGSFGFGELLALLFLRALIAEFAMSAAGLSPSSGDVFMRYILMNGLAVVGLRFYNPSLLST